MTASMKLFPLATIFLSLASVVLSLSPTRAVAQAWPSANPIRSVVPFAAGGPADFAKSVGVKLD